MALSTLPVVLAKREQQKQSLATTKAINPSDSGDLQYLRVTAREIVSNIEGGQWTASQVLEAYISRAAFSHSKTNCLTEVFFDRAREQARALDVGFSATGKIKGPLHGVPISIKDQSQNADLIDQLVNAGAILYVKTNLCQCLFSFECSNPVWGRSLNPYNDAYTCGGSSGGEAALLAMDGSALGIGSDVGGSLRTPASYCGIYSLMPADGRISFAGAVVPVPGFEGIKSVAGPMGRSVDDLVLISKTIIGAPSSRHDIAPVPFGELTLPSKLKFGYYTSDGYIKASPACKRAVLETIAALRKRGHECVEISLADKAIEAARLFLSLTSADNFSTMFSHLGPDKKDDSLFIVSVVPKLPSVVKIFVKWLIETFVGDRIFSKNMGWVGKKSVAEYWSLTNQRNEFVSQFYKDIWEAHALDGIIAPVQAIPQLPHGGCTNFSILAVASFLYNVLDMPVGCLPVTRVDEAQDKITPEWKSEEGHGSLLVEKGIYYDSKKLYDPAHCHGMPINIQVVGKRWEEEKVLGMMKVIDEALGKDRGFGPGAWDKYQEGLNGL